MLLLAKNYWICYCEFQVPATAMAVVPEGLVQWGTGDMTKTCGLGLTPTSRVLPSLYMNKYVGWT